MTLSPPALIIASHEVAAFDCGKESLDQYLKRFALTNSAAGVSRTYVTTAVGEASVVGYYSLAAGSVEKAAVAERVAKGIPNHPVPIVLLARLAVDKRFHGHGLGKSLLRDALQRALRAADVIGIRAMLVYAKEQEAARFYSKFGFAPSPVDPLALILLIKHIKRTISSG
jgi:GNAT superfamily N-acetyltransferase